MNLNLKIGYILEFFPARSETFILNEIRALKKVGIESVIIQLSPYSDEIKLTDNEFRIYSLYSRDWIKMIAELPNFIINLLLNPLAYLSIISKVVKVSPKIGVRGSLRAVVFLPKIEKILKNEFIDHIHAHFAGNPAMFAMFASSVTNIPYSFTIHGKSLFINPFMIREKVLNAKFVVSISKFNKDYLIKKFKLRKSEEKVKIIHCGVDKRNTEKPKGRLGKKLRILTVSRLIQKKGIDDSIRAVRFLKDRGIKFEYTIIGDGPAREDLKNLAKKEKVFEYVKFLGSKPSEVVFEKLSETDVFVLTPKSKDSEIEDGIPVVLMEAGLNNVPVISSKIAGIPELIEDGKDGFLINQGDYKKLAEILLSFQKNPQNAKLLVGRLRSKILEEYDIEKNAEDLAKNYAS